MEEEVIVEAGIFALLLLLLYKLPLFRSFLAEELPVSNSTDIMPGPDDQLEIVSSGERRVSFPSAEKLAVYQEPKEHDFSLCKRITGFCLYTCIHF